MSTAHNHHTHDTLTIQDVTYPGDDRISFAIVASKWGTIARGVLICGEGNEPAEKLIRQLIERNNAQLEAETGGTITIHVEGGVVQDVDDLPDGWNYEIHDLDEDADDIEPEDAGSLTKAYRMAASSDIG